MEAENLRAAEAVFHQLRKRPAFILRKGAMAMAERLGFYRFFRRIADRCIDNIFAPSNSYISGLANWKLSQSVSARMVCFLADKDCMIVFSNALFL